MATSNYLNQLKLDSHHDQHQISLITRQGKLIVDAGKSINLITGDSYTTETGQDHLVTIQNNQQLVTKNGAIEHHSGHDLVLQADRHIVQQTVNNDINFNAANDCSLEVGGNLEFSVQHHDLQLQTQQGNINLHTNNNLVMQADNLFIGNHSHGITITETGELILNANKVTLAAAQINIHQNTEINSNS